MNWLSDNLAFVWLGLALILGAIEMLTLDLFFLAFSIAALAGALTALVGGGFTVQVIAVVVTSLITVGLMRPALMRLLRRQPQAHSTNIPALVGRSVRATSVVTSTGGQVKLAGEIWSARTRDGAPPLTEGEQGWVEAIDGATAIVSRTPPNNSEVPS